MARRGLNSLETHLINKVKDSLAYQRSNKRGKYFFWQSIVRKVADCSSSVSDTDVVIERLLDLDWNSYEDVDGFLSSYEVAEYVPDFYACLEEEINAESEMTKYDEEREEELKAMKMDMLIKALKEWKDWESGYTGEVDVFTGYGGHKEIAKLVRHIITEFEEQFLELYEEEMRQKSVGYEYDDVFGERYGFPAIEFYNKYQSVFMAYDSLKREISVLEKDRKNLKTLMKKYKKIEDEIENKANLIEGSWEVENTKYKETVSEYGPSEEDIVKKVDFFRKMRIKTLERSKETRRIYGRELEDWEYDIMLDILDEKIMEREEERKARDEERKLRRLEKDVEQRRIEDEKVNRFLGNRERAKEEIRVDLTNGIRCVKWDGLAGEYSESMIEENFNIVIQGLERSIGKLVWEKEDEQIVMKDEDGGVWVLRYRPPKEYEKQGRYMLMSLTYAGYDYVDMSEDVIIAIAEATGGATKRHLHLLWSSLYYDVENSKVRAALMHFNSMHQASMPMSALLQYYISNAENQNISDFLSLVLSRYLEEKEKCGGGSDFLTV